MAAKPVSEDAICEPNHPTNINFHHCEYFFHGVTGVSNWVTDINGRPISYYMYPYLFLSFHFLIY